MSGFTLQAENEAAFHRKSLHKVHGQRKTQSSSNFNKESSIELKPLPLLKGKS